MKQGYRLLLGVTFVLKLHYDSNGNSGNIMGSGYQCGFIHNNKYQDKQCLYYRCWSQLLVVIVTIVVTYKNGYKEYIVMTYYNRNTLFEIDHTTTIDANDHTCYYKIFM